MAAKVPFVPTKPASIPRVVSANARQEPRNSSGRVLESLIAAALAPGAAAQVLHYHPGVQQRRDFFPGEAVLQQYF